MGKLRQRKKKKNVGQYIKLAVIGGYAYKVAIIPKMQINYISIQDGAEMKLTETEDTCSDNRHDPVELRLCRPTIPTGCKRESLVS